MDFVKPSLDELCAAMKDPSCVRNVCILAHVDHGKTTIADSLLATNRLVSKRMAGLLRYLDDRPDEQQRGITMKSSAVSLLNYITNESTQEINRLVLNVIDTPGHIDFSTEVSAAVRVSDGAIILVDLVEGVCVQTKEAIKQAFEENAKMILILNKFDRLIIELQKTVDDIFQSILRVIEDCNAIIAELYQYILSDIDIEETGLLFSPDSGNVIFASGIDGWGITLDQMSRMFVNRTKGETAETLSKKMWNFDCYIDSSKEIKTGAIEKKKTNLFTQFFIKTLVTLYETIVVRMEKEKIDKIIQTLGITNITREMKHNDPKVQIKAILQTWKPLAKTILNQCLTVIPPPSKITAQKVNYLLNINKCLEDQYLNNCIEKVIPYFSNINHPEAPTLAYVSKMYCVNKQNLSQNKPKIFVPRPRNEPPPQKPEPEPETTEGALEETKLESDMAVVALARVFCGALKTGQEIFVLSPEYRPDFPEKHAEKVVIRELYMLFGRELILVNEIPAGNFCGIGGLEASVLRTATLSSVREMVPFVEKQAMEPVVRNAIEPANPKDLPVLRQGLKMLLQSDSCVQVLLQETGEFVLVTAGDVHLAKCIEDLTTKFAKVQIHVSSPTVAVRETIVNQTPDYNCLKDAERTVEVEIGQIRLSLVASPLPEKIADIVKNNFDLLTGIEHQKGLEDDRIVEKSFRSEVTRKALIRVKEQLAEGFKEANWDGFQDKIWSVGNMPDSINLLLNGSDFNKSIFLEGVSDERALLDRCIVKAFNTFCKAGPICEEPLMNCAFVVKQFELKEAVEMTPQATAALEAGIRGAFKKAFEKQERRLMEPMFVTDIQVNTNILGKVYTVVYRRHGKVLDAVGMDEQEKAFLVKAQIPVVESVGFANEIRTTTSGQANPNLKFSHYEIMDGDPYHVMTEEELVEGDTAAEELANRVNKIKKDIRKRKGLPVDEEVVTHAEKQRTIKKK